MRQLKPLILLVALLAAAFLYSGHAPSPDVAAPTGATNATAAPIGYRASVAVPDFLPPEARDTLDRIASGGPFSHRQDGVVFGNYENLLPPRPRGFYHEYTVQTPGADTRGTRRIITGGTPPQFYYYTDDHYRSFRAFEVR